MIMRLCRQSLYLQPSPEASVLLETVIAETWLRQVDKDGKCTEMPRVRELIEKVQKRVDQELVGVTEVHGDFYKYVNP